MQARSTWCTFMVTARSSSLGSADRRLVTRMLGICHLPIIGTWTRLARFTPACLGTTWSVRCKQTDLIVLAILTPTRVPRLERVFLMGLWCLQPARTPPPSRAFGSYGQALQLCPQQWVQVRAGQFKGCWSETEQFCQAIPCHGCGASLVMIMIPPASFLIQCFKDRDPRAGNDGAILGGMMRVGRGRSSQLLKIHRIA